MNVHSFYSTQASHCAAASSSDRRPAVERSYLTEALPEDRLEMAREQLETAAVSPKAAGQVARAALGAPDSDALARTAVYTAALAAVSAGVSGPLSVALATAGIEAMEKVADPTSRARAGRPFLEALRQQPFEEQAARKANNVVTITSPLASGAASAYLAGLRDIALEGAPSRPGVGFDLDGRDVSVAAENDFYRHANGGWIANHPIPGDMSRYGRFNELREASTQLQKEILEQAAADSDAAPGSDWKKLGDFYASAMNTEAIEAAGLSPIQGHLEAIRGVENRAQFSELLLGFHNQGLGGLFSFGSTVDYKDSTRVIAETYQGGLGLPSKEYYFNDDERSVAIREAYVGHVARMLELLGHPAEEAAARAQGVMALETRLAEASLSPVEMRDPEALYNLMSRADLAELTPNFSWDRYLDGRGLGEVETVNVATPRFFGALDEALSETPLEDLKAAMEWNLINRTAGALSSRFDEADFDFYGRVLEGLEERQPRETRMAKATSGTMGMALGREYVERAFPPEAKARAREMIENIREAIRDHINGLSWMGEDTRRQAIEKLDKVAVKVGYPDEWPGYEGLQVERGVHGNNVLAAMAFHEAEDIAKIGKPVDRGEWHMSPADVNAYYSPTANEIVFPAAILQPPFFNAEADDAVNYGGIGMVIGHEFTHGFDDKGSQFDGDGNLRNWWTDQDRVEFESRANVIRDQANAYEVEPGLNLNGDLVLGESLADLGGATLALSALQKSLEGKEITEKIDGYTPEQRFFLGMAQVWATNARPEYVRNQVRTDPHPIPEFRVNNTIKNHPAFAAAFDVESGEPMTLPERERAHLW